MNRPSMIKAISPKTKAKAAPKDSAMVSISGQEESMRSSSSRMLYEQSGNEEGHDGESSQHQGVGQLRVDMVYMIRGGGH